MRKRRSVLKAMAVIFTVMFLLNMAAMSIFFNINVIGTLVRQKVEYADMVRSSLSAVEIEDEADEPEAQMGSSAVVGSTAVVGSATVVGSADTDPASSLYAVSPGTVASLQHLSIIDKLAVLSILSKMGTEEIDRIFEMSNDGITFDEYEELKRAAENRLNPSDMEALKKILNRNQGLFAQNPGE